MTRVCHAAQVHAAFGLLDDYGIAVADVTRAGFSSMDSSYATLRALREEVEAGKEAAVAKHGSGLEAGA
jgi:hypothetical protein